MSFFKSRHKPANSTQPAGAKLSAPVVAALREPEPKTVAELARRMRDDYQVQLAERVITANLQAIAVHVAVEQGDARARLLGVRLRDLWSAALPAMLKAFGDGRVAFEKVWTCDAAANLSFVRQLEPLPFEQTQLQLDAEGRFSGIALRGPRGAAIVLGPAKGWWLALDPTPAQPHGRSRYLGAPYETWKKRQDTFRLRNVLLERFALRGGVAHVPPTVEDEYGHLINNFDATAKAYTALQAGGLLLFPNHRDKQGQYEFNYTEPPGLLDPGPLEAVLDGQDVEQLRAFSIPEKTIIEGQAAGSYALVSQQMLILFAIVEDVLAQFCDSFQRYVIDPQVAANFTEETAPRVVIGFTRLSARPDSLLTEVVKSLLTEPRLSELVQSGAVDLRQLLQAAGIPLTPQAASLRARASTPA